MVIVPMCGCVRRGWFRVSFWLDRGLQRFNQIEPPVISGMSLAFSVYKLPMELVRLFLKWAIAEP